MPMKAHWSGGLSHSSGIPGELPGLPCLLLVTAGGDVTAAVSALPVAAEGSPPPELPESARLAAAAASVTALGAEFASAAAASPSAWAAEVDAGVVASLPPLLIGVTGSDLRLSSSSSS
eukprot:scaffold31707_cov30-Prasinocladus_malaysianus.AAC.2